ncbi:carboxypeptidase-like regulatory domain-containing protein [Nubsella zeaxanthinifaciens]|uniref:carboxypeptidase-like regulatory domain-containing protein n=1 Tax=Nubsella zeaxanthinifaciens TaxID=392412 RepID=UPI003D02A181
MTRLLTILIALTILSSCDCYQLVNGVVIDKETGKALQGVTVFNKSKEWIKTTTDETGHFELSSVSGGFGCPPMAIVVETTGYKRNEISIPAGGQEIVKIEKEIPCLPKPDLLDNQPVYSQVDKNAEFPGGQSAFLNYLRQNLSYPKEQKEWQGSIYVTFVVDTLGKIRNECIYKPYFKGEISPIEKVALKLIKETPSWTPAEKNGKKVYNRVTLPIRF